MAHAVGARCNDPVAFGLACQRALCTQRFRLPLVLGQGKKREAFGNSRGVPLRADSVLILELNDFMSTRRDKWI